MLLDCLLETGLLGTGILVYVIINTIRKCSSIIKKNESNLRGFFMISHLISGLKNQNTKKPVPMPVGQRHI